MSMKYLVDFISAPGWSKGHEDIYRSGQLLAEVLPRFGSGEGEIAMPTAPSPAFALPDGNADWSRFSQEQANAYRGEIAAYNKAFAVWARTPTAAEVNLTDKQLEVCQRVIKYFAPRAQEEKDKDKEKQQQPRAELPSNEFSYRLLVALHLSVD